MLRLRSAPAFFLLLFVPLAILIVAGGWWFAEAEFNHRLIRSQAQETSEVALSAASLERSLGGVADDIAFLGSLPELQEAIAQPDRRRLDRLNETFRVFSDSKRIYDQIRWIDETGMERARVDYDRQGGRAHAIAQDALQDKSGRYYFSETSQLEAGAIYLSPFDLNVERGAVERPFNPTLRLATPLVAPDGERHGIVMLNLFGYRLLQRMLAATSDMDRIKDRLMLVNADGYWLRAPSNEDEWGFMLDRPEKTIGRRHPEAWRLMQESAEGQAILADGLWTWQRVTPLVEVQRTASSTASATLADSYVWTVASRLPTEQLTAMRHAAWHRQAWALAIIALLALLGCGVLTRYRSRVVALDAALLKRLHEAEASNYQLAAQERFIRTITEHLPSKVGYWDRDLRCRYANAAYREWFGKEAHDMVGRSMREVLGDTLFDQNDAAIQGALAGQPQRFERLLEKFDGTFGWLQTDYIPDRVGDQVDGFYQLSTDITEIKQAGIKLSELNAELSRRVEEVLAATQAKDDFLSNMSHEIRTPLNAILGLAYLLDAHPLGDEEKDLVHKIRGAGRLLLGIISDILDYSKIEAGRLELEHAPFRLGDVLDSVAAIMATTVGDKDIELTVDAVPAGAENLLGDALRLGQVLNNLVSNAIKFTDHGVVSLHISRIPSTAPTVLLRFAVRDTGIGIPEDKLALIFDAFSQADSSTTRKFGGTGLGLSISRYLVRQMGGDIGVTSTLNEGSEFWFTLPFEVTESSYALPSMALQRVLIVDDSAIARNSLCATVQSLGWSAEAVESGPAAVERCRAQEASGRPFDLLLMDWRMPGMDGLEASKAVRTDCGAGRKVPIIAMVTAHSREDLLRQPDATTADLVLTKPVTASMLYNVISEAKRRRGQAELRPPPSPAAHSRQLPGLRLLVVDDSEINCEVAARILEREGAHVQTVADGQSALDWLRRWPDRVDAVLMDVQMPVMDGYEATQHIRNELGRHDLPIIALTAGAFSYQREAALAAGMNDFLAKPFDVDAMIATLQRMTGCQPEPAAPAEPSPPPAVASSVASSVASPPADVPLLPGIDTARGLRAWSDDASVFRRYLHHFAATYAEAGRRIAELCAAGDTAAAGALAHKLTGAAGNLALPDVERAAREIDAALSAGEQWRTLTGQLQAAIDTVLASLARWDELVPADAAAPGNFDPAAAAEPLRELLAALDRDSPRHAAPLLARLAAHLPADALHAIQDCIDAFDFRGAEAQCRTQAARLGIPVE